MKNLRNVFFNLTHLTYIYNALTIHSVAYLSTQNNGDITGSGNLLSQLEGKFWSKMAYIIGKNDEAFSLDDIEHGILRANRIHPGRKAALFDENDARKKYAVKNFDPRIHFALNCGAKGCPPISFYTIDNLNRGLEMATSNFVSSETKVNIEDKSVELSKLFLWYKTDFTGGQDDDSLLIEYIVKHLKNDHIKHQQLQDLMVDNCAKILITYAAYNWDINAKN